MLNMRSDCLYVLRMITVLSVACSMVGCEETHTSVIVGGGAHVGRVNVRNPVKIHVLLQG